MIQTEIVIKPLPGEKPSAYADRLGLYYAQNGSESHKKEIGQFFTPLPIAQFMASFGNSKKQRIRILDPGCGVGILSIALCEYIAENNEPMEIDLVVFEIDPEILSYSEAAFAYLTAWLQVRHIHCKYYLCKNDFILHNSAVLTAEPSESDLFDVIISNPPYFKLPKSDLRAKAAESVIYGQTNIYSIFLVLAGKLLAKKGRLIFITPRSFCSGEYFRLFRKTFFGLVKPELIHLFSSRKDAFRRDKVLQENVIIVATCKSDKKGISKITISNSEGLTDLDKRTTKTYPAELIMDENSEQQIVHLPIKKLDEDLINLFKKWTGSFEKYDIQISTGRVVDFRNTEYISEVPIKNSVPFFWLHNVERMKINWPNKQKAKGKRKGQYFISNSESKSRLVKNSNYVFVRRFSSKDDAKRLVAAPYFKNKAKLYPYIALENHINYIYGKTREMPDELTMGIAAILNSRFFDLYFRTFNGNINVSATEMRNMSLPEIESIVKIGQYVIAQKNKVTIDLDLLVATILGVKI